MAEKIKLPEWAPDFGPAERHPTAGTVAIGTCRWWPYNINLNTPDLEIASRIAKNIRHINGGLRLAESDGGGTERAEHHAGFHQHDRLYPHRRFTGLSSLHASKPAAEWYRGKRNYRTGTNGGVDRHGIVLSQLENFSMQQVLEARIME